MHAITLVIIYNYVLFGFRSNIIIFYYIIRFAIFRSRSLCLPNPRSSAKKLNVK